MQVIGSSRARRLGLLAVLSVILLMLATACAGSQGEGPAAPSTFAGGGERAGAVERALSTPTPSATPLPDRAACAEIKGTDYRSNTERDWYLANCLPTPVPGPPPPSPPPIPGPDVTGERWVLIDLATQTASAMIGNQTLYTALVTTGMPGWETPKGTWHILYRVANETMTSASIGADEYYVLKDVLYTQYFTSVGHALHLNYWRPNDYFGRVASSHGCVGMRLADAEFFWRFANVGTRVTVQ